MSLMTHHSSISFQLHCNAMRARSGQIPIIKKIEKNWKFIGNPKSKIGIGNPKMIFSFGDF